METPDEIPDMIGYTASRVVVSIHSTSNMVQAIMPVNNPTLDSQELDSYLRTLEAARSYCAASLSIRCVAFTFDAKRGRRSSLPVRRLCEAFFLHNGRVFEVSV